MLGFLTATPTPVGDFLPAGGYLLAVSVAVLGGRRIPHLAHPLAVAALAAWRLSQVGWLATLLPVLAAAVLFAALVLLAGALMSGTGLFSLCAAAAVAPLPQGWLALLAGLLLAGAVGTWRTVRLAGAARARALATQTALAMGVTPAGPGLPNLDLLPELDDRAVLPRRGRLHLPPYLLAGLLAGTVLLAVTR